MKKWATLTILALGMFIIVIDTTIMNVSISNVVSDLNTTVSGVQSAISIFALVMASFILIGGKLGEIIGPKKTFYYGVAIFGVGTFTASISQSLGMLIFGWSLLEGFGSALMLPNIQTLLRDSYKGKDRAFAYGIIGAVGAIGAAVGPIVGGFLTTFYSWRWAFRLEVLVVLVVLACYGFIKADVLSKNKPKLDKTGALLTIFGMGSIVLGILLSTTYGFWNAKQPLIVGNIEIAPFGLSIVPFVLGFGIVMLVLLFKWQNNLILNNKDALFNPKLFSKIGLRPGFITRMLQMMITAGFLFTFPLFLQLTFEYSAIETGVALIPLSLSLLIFAIWGAKLSNKYTGKKIIQYGLLITLVGLLLSLFAIDPQMNSRDMLLGTLFVGAGLGFVSSQIVNLVLSIVSGKETAETAGLNGTFEQLGNSIGVALVGSVLLITLISNINQKILTSELIPDQAKPELMERIETSAQLVSNTALNTYLLENDVPEEIATEIVQTNQLARTQAFEASILFMAFVTIISLFTASNLPNKKLA